VLSPEEVARLLDVAPGLKSTEIYNGVDLPQRRRLNMKSYAPVQDGQARGPDRFSAATVGTPSQRSGTRRQGTHPDNASHNGIAHVAFDREDSLRSREYIISWLTPHAPAVYASCSALPPPHATLLPGGALPPYLGRTCTG